MDDIYQKLSTCTYCLFYIIICSFTNMNIVLQNHILVVTYNLMKNCSQSVPDWQENNLQGEWNESSIKETILLLPSYSLSWYSLFHPACFIQQFTMDAQSYSYTTLNKQLMYHSTIADKKIVVIEWVPPPKTNTCISHIFHLPVYYKCPGLFPIKHTSPGLSMSP